MLNGYVYTHFEDLNGDRYYNQHIINQQYETKHNIQILNHRICFGLSGFIIKERLENNGS